MRSARADQPSAFFQAGRSPDASVLRILEAGRSPDAPVLRILETGRSPDAEEDEDDEEGLDAEERKGTLAFLAVKARCRPNSEY